MPRMSTAHAVTTIGWLTSIRTAPSYCVRRFQAVGKMLELKKRRGHVM